MTRDEYVRMQLAGTVTFPSTFPHLGSLTIRCEAVLGGESHYLLVAEKPSTRVQIVRRVPLAAVRAVFLPADRRKVDYSNGRWVLSQELMASELPEGNCLGIVFVVEDAPCLMDVSVGMTAAEASQYYPPLPNDPARNHYDPLPAQSLGPAPKPVFFDCDG